VAASSTGEEGYFFGSNEIAFTEGYMQNYWSPA